MLTEIQKMWQLIAVSKDSVLELRAMAKGNWRKPGPCISPFYHRQLSIDTQDEGGV